MITRNPPSRASEAPPWRRALREAVTDLGTLLDLLELTPEAVDLSAEAARDFPLRVPRGFVDRMERGDPEDPLLLQVLPVAAELRSPAGYGGDPLGEAAASPVPGLLHKYRGRALLTPTGACAVHCRYCFRRHFPYGDHAGDWAPALDYIATEPTLREVILSGGDPLSLADTKLEKLVDALAAIPHVERLRIHTRLPIVLPERVDRGLSAWLERTELQKVVVVHANHPQELSREVLDAFAELKRSGVTLFNQTVLLKNVNDRPDILSSLSETLFRGGVLPYYLHLLDRVDGASHFEVPEVEARRLVRRMLAELPGYLVPKLVREEAGAPSKTPICPFGA